MSMKHALIGRRTGHRARHAPGGEAFLKRCLRRSVVPSGDVASGKLPDTSHAYELVVGGRVDVAIVDSERLVAEAIEILLPQSLGPANRLLQRQSRAGSVYYVDALGSRAIAVP